MLSTCFLLSYANVINTLFAVVYADNLCAIFPNIYIYTFFFYDNKGFSKSIKGEHEVLAN